MHSVLTLLSHRPVDGLVANHERYARRHGYAHAIVDGTHVYGERQQVLHKYHAIARQLVAMEQGAVLLVLDPFSVVYSPHPLPDVAHGYDAIVTTQASRSSLPAASGMIFRNTLEVRERLRALIATLGAWAMHMPERRHDCEATLLAQCFPPLPFDVRLENGHFASAQTVWFDGLAIDSIAGAQPLVAHHAPEWRQVDGAWVPAVDYDFRYVQALVDDAERFQRGEHPDAMGEWRAAQQRPREPERHVNPGARIAFVSLHTSPIAGYGDLHEENFVRYCTRHGYAYHAYRTPPAFLPDGVDANWAKLHLIREHLPHHDFVFWVDADILAIDQRQPVDSVIAARDFVIGTDHTAWAVNSCMIGVRNVAPMRALVERICARIESFDDRSSVYASGGDQQAIYVELLESGMIDARYIVDAMTLAASPVYATRDSRFVHFPAQHNHYRAVTMRVWDRLSHER
ncbi:hypothetical protein WT72_18070 [Burkholderia pseudomultivorans]|uniref:hypothetical protein n=1 Tax=Burkholderia pseudomultivorans TaxID=1207504 RepID=UPI00075A3A43|nr:hypothetical protein [Burkholderia pseudomultivorans]KWI54509.1 hypothetical protein WT72_18070 [Burkholderia pseudomultivorans]